MSPIFCNRPSASEVDKFHIESLYDLDVLFRLYYIGAEESGIVDIASTGDMTFKHGDSGSEEADTDTKLDAGGLGVIDVSADITDYHSLERHINLTDNWRMVPVGCLPDADPHTTTTGHFTEVTGGNCSAVNGYAVTGDNSDALYLTCGITQRGKPGKIHNTDHQMIHQIHRIVESSTFASGTSTLKVYACDDDDGTKEEILALTSAATTAEVAYPALTTPATEVMAQVKGKRMVVHLLNSAALTAGYIKVDGCSWKVGPSVDSAKLWSKY